MLREPLRWLPPQPMDRFRIGNFFAPRRRSGDGVASQVRRHGRQHSRIIEPGSSDRNGESAPIERSALAGGVCGVSELLGVARRDRGEVARQAEAGSCGLVKRLRGGAQV